MVVTDTAHELIKGAVDLHIHSAPDIFPRNVDALSAARAAQDAGMRAIVVKSHSTDTSARAQTAREQSGFPVFGGVALNYPVGGFNEHAVRECAKQGGRVVWLPTIGARHFVRNSASAGMLADAIPPGVDGMVALDEHDRLLPDVGRVLDAVAETGLTLATGHLAPAETAVVVAEARGRGVERIIVTHPHVSFVSMSLDDMRAVADLGGVVEITDHEPIEQRLAVVEAVGSSRCFLSTDGGTVAEPTPVERLLRSVQGLVDGGVDADDIRTMAVTNPSALLGPT